MAATDPFETREKELLDWCSDQRAYNSRRATDLGIRLRRYRALVLFFSVSVTVLSGVPEVKSRISWAITVAAGLSTFFAGLLTISKAEENYAMFLSADGEFRREVLLYQQRAGPYREMEPEQRLKLLAERVTTVDEKSYSQKIKQITSETKGSG